MVDNKTNENSCKGIDPSSPYYLHPASNMNFALSPVVLRGNNYGEWARSIQNAFKANNKIAFLGGSFLLQLMLVPLRHAYKSIPC